MQMDWAVPILFGILIYYMFQKERKLDAALLESNRNVIDLTNRLSSLEVKFNLIQKSSQTLSTSCEIIIPQRKKPGPKPKAIKEKAP